MLGFHRRTRSLIPVKDLAKYDKVPQVDEVEVNEDELELELDAEYAAAGTMATAKEQGRQLTLVYFMFLAEAYVISLLSLYCLSQERWDERKGKSLI